MPARRLTSLAGYLAALALLSLVAIAAALQVTPMQSAAAVGQRFEVGAAPLDLSLKGPGQLELFGQLLPTRPTFSGPVRPKVALRQITVNEQIATALAPSGHAAAGEELGARLAAAWKRYFVWESVVVGVITLFLAAGTAGILRRPPRHTVLQVASAVLVAESVNLVGIVFAARDTPAALSAVESLSGLVGRSERPLVPASVGVTSPDVQAVVLGDSTAAAIGNPLVPDPTDVDEACQRSSESFADALSSVNGWTVENLACSGATISAGVLGEQQTASLTLPPQLAQARRSTNVNTVVLSIGANDVNWSTLVRLCAASPECDDKATTAFFQQRLQEFADDYFELLRQLGTLASDPQVVVVGYYTPMDPSLRCLDEFGLTKKKQQVLLERLKDVNAVLSKGARAAGARYALPNFSGHELCTPQPYVQGASDPAPFHPTITGELAIALAVQRALATVK